MSKKHCIGCRFADWDVTKAGSLSPTGLGLCTYRIKEPKLAGCMYWPNGYAPHPVLERISRHKPLPRPCPVFQGGTS